MNDCADVWPKSLIVIHREQMNLILANLNRLSIDFLRMMSQGHRTKKSVAAGRLSFIAVHSRKQEPSNLLVAGSIPAEGAP